MIAPRRRRGLEPQEAWVVAYTDEQGERRIKSFDRKKEADEFHDSARVDVRAGVHTPASKSLTVAEAAENWLAHIERKGRERATLAQYRQHVRKHINPRLGKTKLAQLTTPSINTFCDDLMGENSRKMARKVLVSFKSMLREAQRRGGVSQNAALSVEIDPDKRDKPNRALEAIQVKAGVVDTAGKAKYALHGFRHFFASWCINRKADGGLELPAKVVEERLGHSSIVITMDTYGHLFPRSDDTAELAAAEQALLG